MATTTAAAYSDLSDSKAVGEHLAAQIERRLEGRSADAVIVFASSRLDHAIMLEALRDGCRPKLLVGSSSAGEFTKQNRGDGTACALAILAPEMRFSVGLGRGLSQDRAAAARQLFETFEGIDGQDYQYRAAVVMSDGLAGHFDEFVEQLTVLTSGSYQFVGGGAGDDGKFARTHVFAGTEVHTDAVVALEVLSTKPLGVGVEHGWAPASEPLRVTDSQGMCLVALNGFPAVEAFEEYAERTDQRFDRSAPLPFFLHNILGIDTGHGYRLRVPLSINADGSVACAAEIPRGATVRIMKASAQSSTEAAASAARSAMRGLETAKPGAALFFDCVATRLRMGDMFGFELEAVAEALQGADLVGCNTYGQIARGEGQFGGFHNCTAVVFVLPA
ncbi:MAG: hypothetical protein JWN48_4863 [Myxococcaceae bacterium]|nr:hypothetical protein [Myxococcaceae bacterium]